jgi:peroxiredoxin Q/BCP
MIKDGDRAPDFSGVTSDGKRVSLGDFRGKQPLVLYFYPRDNTPVCTKEACSFRDHVAEFAAAGASVLGVSMDSAQSHEKFTTQFGLNFPLLSDQDGTICKTYGVSRLGGWLPPKRKTFVIDREGVVRRVIASELNANRHIDEALAAVREIAGQAQRGS